MSPQESWRHCGCLYSEIQFLRFLLHLTSILQTDAASASVVKGQLHPPAEPTVDFFRGAL